MQVKYTNFAGIVTQDSVKNLVEAGLNESFSGGQIETLENKVENLQKAVSFLCQMLVGEKIMSLTDLLKHVDTYGTDFELIEENETNPET